MSVAGCAVAPASSATSSESLTTHNILRTTRTRKAGTRVCAGGSAGRAQQGACLAGVADAFWLYCTGTQQLFKFE